MKTKIKFIIMLLFSVIFISGMKYENAVYAKDFDTYVYDKAGVLSSEEEEQLNMELKEAREKTGMDFVVVTTNNTGGRSAESYADDFYDEGGFGSSKDRSGMLLLMDFDNRQLHISTAGSMIRILDDKRIESLLDDGIKFMKMGQYYSCASVLIVEILHYVKLGVREGQYNYDRETGKISYYKSPKKITFYELLLSLAVPLIIAGIYIKGVRDDYAMKKAKKKLPAYLLSYRAGAAYNLINDTDEFLGRRTITRHISSDNHHPGGSHGGGGGGFSSTIHTGSSGTAHGGGGRGF